MRTCLAAFLLIASVQSSQGAEPQVKPESQAVRILKNVRSNQGVTIEKWIKKIVNIMEPNAVVSFKYRVFPSQFYAAPIMEGFKLEQADSVYVVLLYRYMDGELAMNVQGQLLLPIPFQVDVKTRKVLPLDGMAEKLLAALAAGTWPEN